MKLDQFNNNSQFSRQPQNTYQAFTLQQIAQAKPQEILDIIMEKNNMIKAFSQQITKFKAEELKTKKLISSLQEKIQKTLPSNNNTSNSFMIPSQFKSLFTNFMTNTVPSVFYDFTQCPKIYSQLLKSILNSTYLKISSILSKKTESICSILLSKDFSKSQGQDQNQSLQIRFHLLNFMQKYPKRIVPTYFEEFLSNQSKNQSKNMFDIKIYDQTFFKSEIVEKIQVLNSFEVQQSEQMRQFAFELYQICIYMIMQQTPWQFVFENDIDCKSTNDSSKKLIYTKKEFTCFDGFIKQGSQVSLVLRGLRKKQNSSKQYHYHPNIKNFVLPFNHDQEEISINASFIINILFLKEFKTQQKQQKQIKDMKNQANQILRDMKRKNIQDLLDEDKNCINKYNDSQMTLIHEDFIQRKLTESKIIPEQSFRLQSIDETSKSQLIHSKAVLKCFPIIENDSNCIIEITQSYTLAGNNSHKQKIGQQQEDKENIHENINYVRPDKKLSTNSKKDKYFLEKNIVTKKNKKQKNNSTIDLTSQKHKASQKNHLNNNVQIQNVKKHEQALFTREIPKSSKKKGVEKSSRKCSVGKIVSQSTQMTGSNLQAKQKISLSQHNTVVMKQSCDIKPLKQYFLQETSHRPAVQNKQNMGPFVGHMYQKHIMRPKKSGKLTKNDDKPLILGCEKKQDRPLALRAYQNGCIVGKLRQKYLIS